MLTTDICSPLQRFSPASHSLIVWFSSPAPTRTHTFTPRFEQPAESLQWHSLVWSKKKKKSLYKRTHFVLNLEYLHILLSPPSQRSHMWQLVQPVVLRLGHLQTLSSAIRWFFPTHRSACIWQTVRTTGLFVMAAVVHNCRDELGKRKYGVKASKKTKQKQAFGPREQIEDTQRKSTCTQRASYIHIFLLKTSSMVDIGPEEVSAFFSLLDTSKWLFIIIMIIILMVSLQLHWPGLHVVLAGSGEKFRLESHIIKDSPRSCRSSGQDKVTVSPMP